MADAASREFFTTRTVAEALAGFRPDRRTRTETVPLHLALRRVPGEPVTAPHPLPGFPRSTVDGYAVRAADTYGVSEGLPGYLTVTGAVRMGAAPEGAVTPGCAIAIPTGGVIPPGADAVVMIEYTAEVMPGTIEVVRPVAPGEGVVRADEDARPGDEIIGGGRPLRPQDLGMLAAAGVTSVTVHKKPVVTIFSTGDEVVPADTPELKPGQVRDATAAALAALVADAGGEPVFGGIMPDDPGALETALRGALPASDVLVISAGSSVGARDETAERCRPPRPARHLVPRPGHQARQAHPAGRMRGGACHRAARQPAFGARGVPADRGAGHPPGRRLYGAAARTLDAGPAVPGSRVSDRSA